MRPRREFIDWIIRVATLDDAGPCEKLLTESYSELLPQAYDDDMLSTALPLLTIPKEDLLTCGTWYIVIHPETNEFVGCGGWTMRASGPAGHLTEEPHPHLRLFATHPDWTRRGIGKRIWKKIQTDVSERLGPSTVLEVLALLTAKDFYASLGFVLVKDLDIEFSTGCRFPIFLMRREPPMVPPRKERINWIIRAATLEDTAPCEKLLTESYSQLLPQDYDHETLSKALPILTTPHEDLLTCGTWYVVQHPETKDFVGCGGWTMRASGPAADLTEAPCPHLRHFATHPEWTRRGIGQMLWQQIIRDVSKAVGLGPSTVLEVFSSLTAKDFYGKFGFVAIKHLHIEFSTDCKFPVILMRREP